MKYPDTVILVDPVIDQYGTEKIGRMETCRASVGVALGHQQNSNRAEITSDAVAYLDPSNSFLREQFYRLEGMMLITQEGEASTDQWYRIQTVNIGEHKLTSNRIDHVQVDLTKTVSLPSVS